MSLPFLTKKPLDIPPIVSVELIQIAEKTNIPYAPKAKKTIEKAKEKEKKLVSEQAPPKKVKKNKTKTVVSTEKNKKIAAIGIKVKRWIAYHGCSININNDLTKYKKIIPCGLSNDMITSFDDLGIKNILNLNKNIKKIFVKNLIKKKF